MQNHELSSNHGYLSDRIDSNSEPTIAKLEADDEVTDSIWHDSCGSDQKRPEVQAGVLLEGGEYEQQQLNRVLRCCT
jgi:hypothetical protein